MSSNGTSDTVFPRIALPTYSEAAYQLLRDKITSCELKPGARVHLGTLERQLGISRTPLKQALQQLELEGLVEIVPRSGTYVTQPTLETLTEFLEIREMFEARALELGLKRATVEQVQELRRIVEGMRALLELDDPEEAAARHMEADVAFHQQLVALAGNQRLTLLHEREITVRMARFERLGFRCSPELIEVAQKAHERILAAVEARDATEARAALRAHIRHAQEDIVRELKQPSDNRTA